MKEAMPTSTFETVDDPSPEFTAFFPVSGLKTTKPQLPNQLCATDGATARLSPDSDEIQLRSSSGQLLFEYRATGSISRVFLPDGDLALATPQGRISLEARDGVYLESESSTEERSALHLTPEAIHLSSAELHGRAVRVHLKAEHASVIAERLDTAYESVRHVVGILETRARRIVESTQESFRQAEELQETKAGRVRWLVKGAFNLLGGYAQIKMDEDLSMDAEQIRLG